MGTTYCQSKREKKEVNYKPKKSKESLSMEKNVSNEEEILKLKEPNKKNYDNDYIRQMTEKNHGTQISLEKMDIIKEQMEKSVCKIKNCNGEYGTGFFCYIPFPNELNLITVLFTNYHVIKGVDFIKDKKIDFSINNDNFSFSLNINNSTKFYSNKLLDISIIEIKEINILNKIKILEFESLSNEEVKLKYKQKDIYLIQYSFDNKVEFSKGIIKDIDENFTIKHSCSSQEGSSGGPLLNLLNFKVIGIHKGQNIDNDYNLGTLIKKAIENFIYTFDVNKNKNVNIIENINENGNKNVNIIENINENIIENNENINENINIEEEYDINVNYLNENPFTKILEFGKKIAITGFATTGGTVGAACALCHFFLHNSNVFNVLEVSFAGGVGFSIIGVSISLFSLIGLGIFNIYKKNKNEKMKKFFDEFEKSEKLKEEREFYQHATKKICSYFEKNIKINGIENKIINNINTISNHFSKIDSKDIKDIYKNFKQKFNNISKYNILVIGKTGIGKSTLINNFLDLKKNKAKEGKTEQPEKIFGWAKKYPKEEEDTDIKGLNLWDTEGIQFSNEGKNDIENHQNKVKRFIEEKKLSLMSRLIAYGFVLME